MNFPLEPLTQGCRVPGCGKPKAWEFNVKVKETAKSAREEYLGAS